MASIEWFTEIGNQQYDSLKPPGDISHETFNTATIGLESFGGGGGGGGGGKDYTKKAHKYNKKKYSFDNKIAKEQWKHTTKINQAKREDNKEAHAFQTQQRKDSYDQAKLVRKFNHEEKVRARTEVIRHINKQLEYNDLARGKAHLNARAVEQERQIKLALNARKSATEYEQKGEQLELKADQNRLAYKTRMKGLNLEEASTYIRHRIQTRDLQNKKTQTTLKYQGAAAEQAFKQATSVRERIKATGKTRLLQAGQSAQATGRDVIAAFQQQDAQNLHRVKTMDLQSQVEQYGINNAMIGLAGQRYYEMGKQALEKYSTQEARALQIRGQESDQRYLNLFRDIRLEEERQTGLSITAAYDRMIDDIDMKWEGAKIAAEAKIPLHPNITPPPIEPRAIPIGRIIDPPKPKKGPKPIKGSSYAPSQAVQGSMTGSILSGVSAGATALGAFGSMAASGGGAIGLGGLGTIGLGAMGPIGLGVGLVAGIGKVFNWW